MLQHLPKKTARIDALIRQTNEADISGCYTARLDMFTVPGYANASFMKRRAMLVKSLLGSLPVKLFPGEWIVGSTLGLMPELVTDTYEERCVYADMSLAFPARNTLFGTDIYTPENRRLTETELHRNEAGRWNWGHSCFGLEKILRKGYLGIARDAQEQLAAHPDATPEQKDFWESVIMCCEAVNDYAGRYAAQLQRLAEEETDGTRARELRMIARCVSRVPAHPAGSFYEALQACWFAFMCHILFNGTDLGRFDQVVYPYYEKDIASGAITCEQAQEWLDCLWVKFIEWPRWHPEGRGHHPSIMLAGLKADGTDGTNALTYLCMNATRHVGAPQPKLSLRVNEQTPQELFELAHDMLLSGLMMPDFYNERVIIAAYGAMGVPFEDAVCFAQSVCEEVSLAGISEECTNEGPHIDLHHLVMEALRHAAAEGLSFEDILANVDQGIARRVADEVDFHNRQTAKLSRFLPVPLHSATILGCVESGRDILSGGAKYNNTGSVISGIATAANSLYSVKRLVFDEKRLTLRELLAIVDSNWADQEALRAEVLSRFPKYGNDNDEVDQYAVRMFRTFADELGKYTNSRGGRFKVGAWASEFRSNYQATPDGRRRYDSFAVNVSPTPGSDVKGATAVICSTTKLDLRRCTAGGMIDITLSPSSIRGEKGVEVLKSLVETYCQLGGVAMQFNFVDSAMLENAQREPLKYKNLMVRVWGYNDYYVALPEKMQNHILDRTRREEGL